MTGRIIDSFPQTRQLPVRAVRLGLRARIFSGGTPDKSNLDFWTDGDLPWIGSGEVNQKTITVPTAYITREAVRGSATRLFPAMTVAMALAGQGKTKAMVATMGTAAYGNQSLACIADYDGDSKFLFWWLTSLYREIRGLSSQDTRDGLNQAMVGQIPVPDFELETQRAIASFLDHETARIDQLIEKKLRLVELLVAKQETYRDTAVCKGLVEQVLYKESGVDWFGQVPEHWAVCRFNRLISSKVDYRGRTPEKVDDGVFLVTARNIRPGKIDYERSQEFTTQEDWDKLSARGKPSIGDVLFTTEAPLGNVAQVDRTDVAYAQRIMKFRANERLVSNNFLAELMMSASFQRSLNLYASGSTASGIKSERFAHLFGLIPPPDEQEEIVRAIREHIKRVDAVIEPLQRSIDRSREFRSALITAAVTGQINVASWCKRGETDRRLDQIQEAMSA